MLAIATALAVLALPQNPPDPAVLQQELTRLVDLATPKARALAAEALAKKGLASVDEWRAACARFGEFAPLEAGPSRQQVDLTVLGQVENTEVHLFVPKGYDAKKPTPLLLWGHGAGGSGAREHLAWQQIADTIGLLVLAPTEFGKVAGWGSSPRERENQLAALRWARRTANVDENAIFVGGCSRGGHMTWDLALRWPDLWAGMLPCIGGPRLQLGPTNNLRYLENVAALPIRDLQGSQDDPLLLDNLHLAFERLQKWKAKDAVLREFADLGHSYDPSVIDWGAFFALRREPLPKRIVRMVADVDEGRAAWCEVTRIDGKIRPEAAPEVSAQLWNSLDEKKQRAYMLDRLIDATARLDVQDRGNGQFVATGRGVQGFALLLTPAMLGKDGKVEVRWQNRPVRKTAVASAAVLLAEFAERFDRTFLPVARLAVP